jgi:hypothetical protein
MLASQVIIGIGLLVCPTPALATQGHGAPEGLYIHQIAHIFFALSMAMLIYWLRRRRLIERSGWRYIQFCALFFIIWNFVAFTAHLLDEQIRAVHIQRVDSLHIRIQAVHWTVGVVYYITKLDHLVCVPALIFLYSGLKRLFQQSDNSLSVRGADDLF